MDIKLRTKHIILDNLSKLINPSLIILFIVINTSCLFDSSTTKLIHGYELIHIDSKWNLSIYKGEEQISGYVYSVGYNDKYIIAKQHPLKKGFYSKPNYEITNFYIIDILENRKGYKNGIIGPLSESKFNNFLEKNSLLDKIQFTIKE